MKLKKLTKIMGDDVVIGVGNEYGDFLGNFRADSVCQILGKNCKVTRIWCNSAVPRINITLASDYEKK